MVKINWEANRVDYQDSNIRYHFNIIYFYGQIHNLAHVQTQY